MNITFETSLSMLLQAFSADSVSSSPYLLTNGRPMLPEKILLLILLNRAHLFPDRRRQMCNCSSKAGSKDGSEAQK